MTSFNQNVDDILFFQKIIKFRWMRGRWADGDWCVFALIFRKKFRTLGAAHRGRWLMAVKIVEMSCGGHWKCAANIFFFHFTSEKKQSNAILLFRCVYRSSIVALGRHFLSPVTQRHLAAGMWNGPIFAIFGTRRWRH